MIIEDFHTHNLRAVPGSAIVNLPREALLDPGSFAMMAGGVYSVGVHPWWTEGDLTCLWQGLEAWARHRQIVAIGECGLDKIRGADLSVQEEIFSRQVEMANRLRLPVTVHCVKAFDRLLAMHKQTCPVTQWTVHGFRGKPELARQLLEAGLNLSFGCRFNEASWKITPADRRYRETDDGHILGGKSD